MAVIAAYNFCNRDFDAFLGGAAAAGFNHVAVGFYPGYLDLPLETLSDAQVGHLLEKLAGHGLSLIAVFLRSDLRAEDGLELLQRRLDGAARLGVAIADTGAVHVPDDASADERARLEELFVERIREAGDYAGALGITICLETHGGFTGDAHRCLRAMARIDHPCVRLAYDPANFRFYCGADPHERLDELVPFIGHTHYKDHRGAQGEPDFPRIGEGEVGYETLLPRLVELGYAGPHTLERAPGGNTAEINASLRWGYEYLSRYLG